MVTTVIGGACSGKSEYAEACLKDVQGEKIYLATMIASDEESRERVRRHRQRRMGQGFRTLECPVDLKEAAEGIPAGSAVLVECIGNLAANELFRSPEPLSFSRDKEACPDRERFEGAKSRILDGLRILASRAGTLVVVSNEVNRAGCEYAGDTKLYQKLVGEVNQELCRSCERVVEMAGGLAIERKALSQDE